MNADQVVKWLGDNGFTREADRVTTVLAAEAALAPPPKPEPEPEPPPKPEPEPEPPKEVPKEAPKPAAKSAAKKGKAKE